jgi:alpha-1,3-rhamnosyl/mannosyltransferase
VTRPSVALLAHRVASPSATGIGRYYVEIAKSLATGGHPYEYVLANTREPEQPTWLPSGLTRRIVPGPRKLVALSWALTGRPRADRALGRPDLLHALHPWTATPSRAPLVTTIHDLMPTQHRAWYPRHESWLFGRGVAYAREHAAVVITDAEYVAQQLVAEAGIDRSRIRVIHLAVGDEFRTRPDAALAAEVCARHGVEPGRYLIAVGQIARRKNLGVVLDALAKVDPGALGRPALLAAGPPGVGADEITAQIERLGLGERVRLGGYVPSEELPVLVSQALALVHPSRDEGFGFTPIEAMAAGVPVIMSASGALPEVAGDAGVLVDPADADAWAAAIDRVAREPEWRAALTARGDAHQERFRWSRVAADTAAVHAEVLRGRGTER